MWDDRWKKKLFLGGVVKKVALSRFLGFEATLKSDFALGLQNRGESRLIEAKKSSLS